MGEPRLLLFLCHLDPGYCVAWMSLPLWIGHPGGPSLQRLPPPAACRLLSHFLTFTPALEEGGQKLLFGHRGASSTGFRAPVQVWGLP